VPRTLPLHTAGAGAAGSTALTVSAPLKFPAVSAITWPIASMLTWAGAEPSGVIAS